MIYLDYQSTTPMAIEAVWAMRHFHLRNYANPHSPSREGREAAAMIEVAQGHVERLIGLDGGKAHFTSGATEALNWAIKGTMARTKRRKIVTIATEHAAVLDTCDWLAGQGVEVVKLPVDKEGLVDLDAARKAIDDKTALVAAMLVNNEIGVIQPVDALGEMAHGVGAVMICDAVQGAGRVDMPTTPDLIAISAHKIYGPKGIGALWIRDGHAPEPLIHGGGQQDALRSGTLSPALCVGFGEAARLMHERREEDAAHVKAVAKQLLKSLGKSWILNGAKEPRYAGNLNLRREGLDAARLLSDCRDIAFSLGSACGSGSGRPSHVLRGLGLSRSEVSQSIRLGIGRYTTMDQVQEAGTHILVYAMAQQEVPS